jgi:hypothetical protein
MTITSRMTRWGNLIHFVSPTDLVDAVQSGERLRAYCPIHGSDHQRSLSIDCSTGWGFCHSCHATVLLQSMASVMTSSQGNRDGQRSVQSRLANEASTLHLPMHPSRLRRVHNTASAPLWQQEEVVALSAAAPMMRAALISSRRAQLYLAERSLPPAVAQACGAGTGCR